MTIPLINYLLTSVIVFLGLPVGVLLAVIAEEELTQFKKFIAFFTRYLGYNFHKTRQIISALLFFISSYNSTAFILTASFVFIYFTRIGVMYYNAYYKKSKKRSYIYLGILRDNILFLVLSILLYLPTYLL